MGIDIGSFESKGVLVDEDGRVVAAAVRKHVMENPSPGFYEHDAEKVWWGEFCEISLELLEKSGVSPSDVAAVGASALGADCVPVDEDCRPLRKAILYGIDSRTTEELKFLDDYFGAERVIEMRGSSFGSEDAVAKILWIRRNEPEIFARARKFCTGSTFLTAKLTGEYVIDDFLARTCFFPAYWPDGEIRGDLLGEFFRPDQIPSRKATTDIAGTVTPDAARATGLAEGTPVLTGTDDAAAEAISAGVLEAGDMMVMLGSSMYLICVTDGDVRDERMWGGGYVIPGAFTMQGATNNAGTITRWLLDNMFFDCAEAEKNGGPNAFAEMMRLAEDVPPGCGGLIALPYFAGERSPVADPRARGVLFGLTLKHTRAHVYRAFLESVAYCLRQHLDIMDERGVRPGNVIAAGGGTKNSLWMRILADVCGVALKTPEADAGASYGDALMTMIATGHVKDFPSLKKIIRYSREYEPDMEIHKTYGRRYEIFNRLYVQNKETMRELEDFSV
jgi:xylulokinase